MNSGVKMNFRNALKWVPFAPYVSFLVRVLLAFPVLVVSFCFASLFFFFLLLFSFLCSLCAAAKSVATLGRGKRIKIGLWPKVAAEVGQACLAANVRAPNQVSKTPMLKHGSVVRQTMYLASMDIKTAFDEARPRHVAHIMEGHNTHGWIVAALLCHMAGLEGQAMFECEESMFSFTRCLRQGSDGTPRVWQKMAQQFLANVEEGWTKEKNGTAFRPSSMLADNFWIMSNSKCHLEQMLKDLSQETEKWDFAPKPASLWWTSTIDSEEKIDLSIKTKKNRLKIVGCTMPSRRKQRSPVPLQCWSKSEDGKKRSGRG